MHLNRSLTILLAILTISQLSTSQNMDSSADREALSMLNTQFIRNFIKHDTVAHNEIIHKDFVCIESNGQVVNRVQYMKDWAHDYQDGGFTSFTQGDEFIRIFGNVALVRSRTTSTRRKNGVNIAGGSIYTDTYVKENGRWWCVQAQITAIPKQQN